MKDDSGRLQYLFNQFVLKQASPQELDELFQLLKEPGHEHQSLELLNRYFEQSSGVAAEPLQPQSRLRFLYRSRWWAAAAVLVVTAGILYWRSPRPAENPAFPTAHSHPDLRAPQSAHAILTLADGRKISLDSAANGALVMQGATRITKLKDGQIAYSGNSGESGFQYNTLEVPRGSRITTITLDDGTRVWLNSGSSLKYPVAFPVQERKVEITGEAYFEVAKNEGRPFIVSGGGLTTEVLATEFNINVYEDETEQRVTLLEGAIRVHKGSEQNILKPGQQVRISSSGQMDLLSKVDLEAVMAWKNAMFVMEKSDIATILRQIARWYNVEIVYPDGIPRGQLSGDITREMELSKVLKVMELSGVHFRMEDRKVIVSP